MARLERSPALIRRSLPGQPPAAVWSRTPGLEGAHGHRAAQDRDVRHARPCHRERIFPGRRGAALVTGPGERVREGLADDAALIYEQDRAHGSSPRTPRSRGGIGGRGDPRMKFNDAGGLYARMWAGHADRGDAPSDAGASNLRQTPAPARRPRPTNGDLRELWQGVLTLGLAAALETPWPPADASGTPEPHQSSVTDALTREGSGFFARLTHSPRRSPRPNRTATLDDAPRPGNRPGPGGHRSRAYTRDRERSQPTAQAGFTPGDFLSGLEGSPTRVIL